MLKSRNERHIVRRECHDTRHPHAHRVYVQLITHTAPPPADRRALSGDSRHPTKGKAARSPRTPHAATTVRGTVGGRRYSRLQPYNKHARRLTRRPSSQGEDSYTRYGRTVTRRPRSGHMRSGGVRRFAVGRSEARGSEGWVTRGSTRKWPCRNPFRGLSAERRRWGSGVWATDVWRRPPPPQRLGPLRAVISPVTRSGLAPRRGERRQGRHNA